MAIRASIKKYRLEGFHRTEAGLHRRKHCLKELLPKKDRMGRLLQDRRPPRRISTKQKAVQKGFNRTENHLEGLPQNIKNPKTLSAEHQTAQKSLFRGEEGLLQNRRPLSRASTEKILSKRASSDKNVEWKDLYRIEDHLGEYLQDRRLPRMAFIEQKTTQKGFHRK